MLTKADDYPIHQLPEPIATAGTDRNFYDRYFFNGYAKDGTHFFACALGVYPHLNIMDAAFSVVTGGRQHNLRASRVLHQERMETSVGPIAVDVVEPLKRLALRIEDKEHGIEADLTFSARTVPIEEPRFTYRQGPRTLLDYTRLTQNGLWQGTITVTGETIEVSEDRFWGTRDRSWGVRPIGAGDPQPVAPPPPPQFYWLWAPLNFDDRITLYHNNADATGHSWNTAGVMCFCDADAPDEMASVRSSVTFKSGTRHAKKAVIHFENKRGRDIRIDLEPKWNFYMSGIGYTHPEWGHGTYHGELASAYDSFATDEVDEADLPFNHVQAFVEAALTVDGEDERRGSGILEQLIIGPHAPSGFKGILDTAP